jgi:hypothetical protein
MAPTAHETLDHIRLSFLPDIKVIPKSESWLQRFIGYALAPITGGAYMTRFWTTIGQTIYTSSDPGTWDMAYHETCHVRQHRLLGLSYSIDYLLPQLMVLPTLFIAILVGSGWWSLVALAWLLPFPSRSRMEMELEAYSMQLALMELQNPGVGEDVIELIVPNFTGPSYYFMWPHAKSVRGWLNETLRDVRENGDAGLPIGVNDVALWYNAVRFMAHHDLIAPEMQKMSRFNRR